MTQNAVTAVVTTATLTKMLLPRKRQKMKSTWRPPIESCRDNWQRQLWLSGYIEAIETIEDVVRAFTSVGLTTVSAQSLQDAFDRLKSAYDR